MCGHIGCYMRMIGYKLDIKELRKKNKRINNLNIRVKRLYTKMLEDELHKFKSVGHDFPYMLDIIYMELNKNK